MWPNLISCNIYASEQFSHLHALLHHKSYRLGVFQCKGLSPMGFSFRIEASYGATSESVEICVLRMQVSS
jgi:hypothetical protein